MSRAFGLFGSIPSFEGLYSSKASLTQLQDLPSEGILRPTPLPENRSWSKKEGKSAFHKVGSSSSLDSLELDDTVQYCEQNVPDLLSGEPLKSTNTSLENLKEVLILPRLESGLTLEKPEAGPQRYPPHVRRAKIARYKLKLQHRRARIPISRHFAGRSHVAKGKVRVNGKFTKS